MAEREPSGTSARRFSARGWPELPKGLSDDGRLVSTKAFQTHASPCEPGVAGSNPTLRKQAERLDVDRETRLLRLPYRTALNNVDQKQHHRDHQEDVQQPA